jgi:hypothetical protein
MAGTGQQGRPLCRSGSLGRLRRSDSFLADFGKRQVLRVTTARDGATFRTARRRDVFADVPEDFRPVGIAWSADGLSPVVPWISRWSRRPLVDRLPGDIQSRPVFVALDDDQG